MQPDNALFIAADGGGSKTEFALFTSTGHILERFTLGGSNPNSVGFEAACNVIDQGFSMAEAASGGAPVIGRFAGISGALSGDYKVKLKEALSSAHPALAIDSDIINVIFSADKPSRCIAAIAGTGTAVFGYDGLSLFRSGGWGYLLDGAGGGYDIGREVIRLCLESDDDPAAPKLELVRLAEEKLGGRALDSLSKFYSEGPDFIASFAMVAFDAARAGDELASRIIRKQVSRLALQSISMRDKCDCGNHLVLSGGLLASRDVLLPMLEESVSGLLEIEIPEVPQIIGACRRCLDLFSGEILPLSRFDVSQASERSVLSSSHIATTVDPLPPTERRNPRSMKIDKMDAVSMLRLINDENMRSVEAVESAIASISRAVQVVAESFRTGGRLIYAGAGTSGRLAVQDASECPPTYGVDYNTVVANIAGGKEAVFRAVEQVEDSASAGREDLIARGISQNDVVMGVSASGNAEYVVSALKYAKETGCKTISLSSNKNCRIAQIADVAIFTDTGSEVITGSTRMKAGNAQKMVMNMITTCAMVMTGKVCENMMVNLRPTNAKLKNRMVRIVSEILGCCHDESLSLLENSGFDIKKAINEAGEDRGNHQ